MHVKVLLQGEYSAIFPTFFKLPFVIKIFVLSIFEWTLKIGFTVDSVVVKKRKCFSFHRGFLTYAVYHHGEIIKLILPPMTKQKRVLHSQRVRAKENPYLSHGGPSQDKHPPQ